MAPRLEKLVGVLCLAIKTQSLQMWTHIHKALFAQIKCVCEYISCMYELISR